jgi:hypothetical protein
MLEYRQLLINKLRRMPLEEEPYGADIYSWFFCFGKKATPKPAMQYLFQQVSG